MTELNRYNLFLSSTQRTSGTVENPNYILSRPLFKLHPHSNWLVKVTNATIPYSFQQICSGYNMLTYSMTRTAFTPISNASISVSPGNYTINSLLAAVSTALSNDVQSRTAFGYSPNFVFSYTSATLKVSFQVTGTDSNTTLFTFKPSSLLLGGLAYNMGITSPSGVSFGYTNYVVYTVGYSNALVNIAPITAVFIRAMTLTQNMSYEFIANKDDFSDILIQIPIGTVGGTIIQYENQSDIRVQIKNDYIDQLQLYLSDNRSFSLANTGLNGLDWSCVIEFIEIESMTLKDNEAYQMLKNVDFGNHNEEPEK